MRSNIHNSSARRDAVSETKHRQVNPPTFNAKGHLCSTFHTLAKANYARSECHRRCLKKNMKNEIKIERIKNQHSEKLQDTTPKTG